ncbi:MAG: peptide chain release factor N(5)-glutamine methyltransferase, partial [Firmicutes bacterium]|nr:peptide chain release factor N(5)-glutamine methyltransferase [Bacillota bacterium]
MMRGKEAMAISVRDADGVIRTETKRIKSMKKRSVFFRIPIIRGMLIFLITLADGMKTLTKSAEVFAETEPTKFESWFSKKFKINLMTVVSVFSVILGLGIAIALFILLPQLMLDWIKVDPESYEHALIGGAFKIGILLIYLIAVSFIKDIKRTFRYHGAEHKTINCFEHELPLTVENAKNCSKLHNRCGTTFLFFVILVSVGVSLLLPIKDTWLRILVRIATLPIVAGLAYELLKFLAIANFIVFRILFFPLKVPGLLMQLITTKEPDDKMIEVAITAFKAVQEMDENPDIKEVSFPKMKKYQEVYDEMQSKLKQNGILQDADLDWILCSVLKRRRSELKETKVVSVKEYDTIKTLVEKRCQNMPVQYVLSETDFFGYTLKLNASVLIPRFETELLCERAIKCANEKSNVLDLCCGSGAIGIAISKKVKCKVTCSDISEEALKLAKENAALNETEIDFIKSDMFKSIKGKFDIIVCNPPYVKTADIQTLSPEVKDFEPHLSLDGGADGLDFYRIIEGEAAEHLNDKGILFLECGIEQSKEIEKMLKSKFDIKIYKDYSGIERFIKAVKK